MDRFVPSLVTPAIMAEVSTAVKLRAEQKLAPNGQYAVRASASVEGSFAPPTVSETVSARRSAFSQLSFDFLSRLDILFVLTRYVSPIPALVSNGTINGANGLVLARKSDSYSRETHRIPPLRHILDLFPLVNPVN
jgi:hypothetical protein